VVALVVLTIKPWGGTDADAPAQTDPAGAQPTGASHAKIASPTAAAPSARIPGICIDVGAWLLTTVELDRDRTIRVWRAIDFGANATGPLDPTIPLTQLRTDGVLGLGWCAPVVGSDASTDAATVQAWLVDGRTATSIALTELDPNAPSSGYGALYRPFDPATSTWSQGTYVFRHVTSDGRGHWFKVLITDKSRMPLPGPTSGRGARQR
jgi:hypothetical protein